MQLSYLMPFNYPLIHLLEEVNPLVFLYCPGSFWSANLMFLHSSIKRLALLFICMEGKHYNKLTLSWISDDDFHRNHFPRYKDLVNNQKRNWNCIIHIFSDTLIYTRKASIDLWLSMPTFLVFNCFIHELSATFCFLFFLLHPSTALIPAPCYYPLSTIISAGQWSCKKC